MFNFLQDIGNYEARCVGRLDIDENAFVSTARVSDGEHDYETAVKHPDYNSGKMVIVEAYDTKAQAEAGHARWVATMTAAELPTELRDCSNSGLQQMCDVLSGDRSVYPRVLSQ